jgi:hypothetical protein
MCMTANGEKSGYGLRVTRIRVLEHRRSLKLGRAVRRARTGPEMTRTSPRRPALPPYGLRVGGVGVGRARRPRAGLRQRGA